MPDITMCKPQRCKLKITCMRYLSTPSDRQSYFSAEPSNNLGTECEMYIEKKCKTCGQK